jgi:uncharacterized protein (TIGR02246 family)
MAERVLIADDNPVQRRVLAGALREAGFELCGEAADADAAIALAARERPDLCLLDIYMPGSGIRAAEEIARRAPATAVVMLTASARDQDLLDSLQAGARGYLPKDISVERLRQRLRDVLAGEVVIPRRLVAKALTLPHREPAVPLDAVGAVEPSARQRTLLDMLADGRTVDEIASRLLISTAEAELEVDELLTLLRASDPQVAGRTAIEWARAAHLSSLMAGDAEAWVAGFAEDGVHMPANGPRNVGRAEIRAWHAAWLAPRGARFTFTPAELRVISDGWAFESGTYALSFVPARAGGPAWEGGSYLRLYSRREGERWLIAREIWSLGAPPLS